MGKAPRGDAQDEHHGKLQTLRGVHAHHLYGVRGNLRLRRFNRAPGLEEVLEVLPEIRKLPRLAFTLPLLQKFPEGLNIGAVLIVQRKVQLQPGGQPVEQRRHGGVLGKFAQLSEQAVQFRPPRLLQAVGRPRPFPRLEYVVERAAVTCGLLTNFLRQVLWELPPRRQQHARQADVFVQRMNNVQIRHQIAQDDGRNNRKPADDEGNLLPS